MQYRNFTGDQEQVSLLGFGCMRLPRTGEDTQQIDYERAQQMVDYAIANGVNYFDTAWMYHEEGSEPFIGQALKKYPRASYNLATKLPPWRLEDDKPPQYFFESQLERCGVDYFDYYLLHSLSAGEFESMEKYKPYEYLLEQKKQGRIRHLGFSFHDQPHVLKEFLKMHEWDFVQIQLNYFDWEQQNAQRQYELIAEAGLPVVVMEPVRGGALATLPKSALEVLQAHNPQASAVSWALRYVASLPNVLTVLSGMSSLEQVQENVEIMSGFSPLTGEERAVLDEALQAYRASGVIPCTGCRYCMDCPAGVDIPRVFANYNQYCISHNMIAFRNGNRAIGKPGWPRNCVRCGQCVPRCPQGIDIPGQLEMVAQRQNEIYAELAKA